MKRFAFAILFIVLAAGLFAAPATETATVESAEAIDITVLHAGQANLLDFGTDFDWAVDAVKKDFPGATVELLQVDLADGSALTITAMLAAGNAPNVYKDTLVRSSSYILPDYALALDDYIRDLDAYLPSTLAPFRRDGDLLALPEPGGAQAMAINLDMMAEIGYTVPEDWTIADFLEMAELVRIKYGGEKWATGMFAGNQSGDYLINNWFASFGVDYYQNGDYSQTTIAETGGAIVHEFFQLLMSNDYIRPDAATQVDDDYVLDWAKGDLAATAFFQTWTGYYFGVVMDAGYIDRPFDYTFVPFPKALASDGPVPTYYSSGAMVVHDTGTDEDAVAARLAEYLNSPMIQALKTDRKSVV